MKKNIQFKFTIISTVIFMMISILMLSSCEKEDVGNQYTGPEVWNNQFYFGNTKVNGLNTLTNEFETTQNHIKDKVCYSDLPSGAFNFWSFNIYIPSSSELLSGFDTKSVLIYYSGASLELDDNNIQLSNAGSDVISGVNYSVFSVQITIPNSNVNSGNFQALYFGFDMIHKDSQTGKEYNRDGKFIQIDISNCGSSGTSGYNCVSGNCNYVSSNASYSSLSTCQSACGTSSGSGYVTFYTTSDLGCGPINVTINGYGSGTINSYYTSGINNCNVSGCANFTLPPGNHTFEASCNGYVWGPASFTITNGGCLRYELSL